MKRTVIAFWTVCLSIALCAGRYSDGQTPPHQPKSFPLLNFDETNDTCRAKGRLQDREYCRSKLVDQILARGKSAIPILISQLTDTRATKMPIFDFWSKTTVGDIADFLLRDLFTESDGETFNMPGLEALPDNCQDAAETCWRAFLRKHGRKFVQDKWLAAWNANKDRVYWNEQARCFRLTRKPG